MEFDPTLGANKSKKELLEKQAAENEKLASENIVYNPKTGESDFVENLPFAEDGATIVLEKDPSRFKIAKDIILPLSNMMENEKKHPKKDEITEEFSEDTEE